MNTWIRTLAVVAVFATGCAAQGDSTDGTTENVDTDQAALTGTGPRPPLGTPNSCTRLAPSGPPLAAPSAPAEFPIDELRRLLDGAGNTIISTVTAQQPSVNFRWASNLAKPSICGYDCLSPANRNWTSACSPTLNDYFYLMHAQLHFTGTVYGVSREIYANVDITFSCDGWRTGAGNLNLTTSAPQILVLDDDNALVDFFDFFSNGAVTNAIDSAIESSIANMAPGGTTTSFGSCSSLGAVVNTSTNQYWGDYVMWDR